MFRILVIGIVGTVCVGSFFSLVSVIVGGVVGFFRRRTRQE